jgi:hypothetical protein
MMTADTATTSRASRVRVARTRGVGSGGLLLLLGAWAALVPFIGPYLKLAYTPQPNTAWHWTAARGWLEVLPGAVIFAGAVLLIASASRMVTNLGAWLAAAGGAWLLVGPSLTGPLSLHLGTPDPASGTDTRALEMLLFFYAIGAATVFLAGIALGRLTIRSPRDVRAAERRLAAEEATAPAATSAPAAAPTSAPGYPAAPPAPGYANGTPATAGTSGTPATAGTSGTPATAGTSGTPATAGTDGRTTSAEPTYAGGTPPNSGTR